MIHDYTRFEDLDRVQNMFMRGSPCFGRVRIHGQVVSRIVIQDNFVLLDGLKW